MSDDPSEAGTGPTATRRAVLEAAGTGSAIAALGTPFSTGAAATDTEPDGASAADPLFDVDHTGETMFPQSVARGGPTPDGAIVWTRVAEAAYEGDRTVDSAEAPRRLVRSYRVPEGDVEIQELQGSPTDLPSTPFGAADGSGAAGLADTGSAAVDRPEAVDSPGSIPGEVADV